MNEQLSSLAQSECVSINFIASSKCVVTRSQSRRDVVVVHWWSGVLSWARVSRRHIRRTVLSLQFVFISIRLMHFVKRELPLHTQNYLLATHCRNNDSAMQISRRTREVHTYIRRWRFTTIFCVCSYRLRNVTIFLTLANVSRRKLHMMLFASHYQHKRKATKKRESKFKVSSVRSV